MKKKSIKQSQPQPDSVEQQIFLFQSALEKCLATPSVREFSIAKFRRNLFPTGKIERGYRYQAVFLSGPFDEHKTLLDKEYFRFLDFDELVNLIFNALSSNNNFVFDFKTGKYMKRFMVAG